LVDELRLSHPVNRVSPVKAMLWMPRAVTGQEETLRKREHHPTECLLSAY
jgi:hypothetical protein